MKDNVRNYERMAPWEIQNAFRDCWWDANAILKHTDTKLRTHQLIDM